MASSALTSEEETTFPMLLLYSDLWSRIGSSRASMYTVHIQCGGGGEFSPRWSFTNFPEFPETVCEHCCGHSSCNWFSGDEFWAIFSGQRLFDQALPLVVWSETIHPEIISFQYLPLTVCFVCVVRNSALLFPR